MALDNKSIDIVIQVASDLLYRGRVSPHREVFGDELRDNRNLRTEFENFLVAFVDFAQSAERVNLNIPANLSAVVDDAISLSVGHWLNSKCPDDLYRQLSDEHRRDAKDSTRKIEQFYDAFEEFERGSRSGGLTRGGSGGASTGFNRSGGFGQPQSQGGGSNSYFGGRSPQSVSTTTNAFGRQGVSIGPVSSAVPNADVEPRIPRAFIGSIRSEVATANRSVEPIPKQQPVAAQENTVTETIEVIYMDEARHRTDGLLRAITNGDQQTRLLSKEIAEDYFDRSSVMDCIRRHHANPNEPIVPKDISYVTTPICIGTILDTTPDVPSLVKLKQQLALHPELGNADISEAPVFALRYSYYDWGFPATIDPSFINYAGTTHEQNIELLNKLERISPPQEFRMLLGTITKAVNFWLTQHSIEVTIDSYVLDGAEISNYIKQMGQIDAKAKWVMYGKDIGRQLRPEGLNIQDDETVVSYHYLNRCEAIAKIPMRGVQCPLGFSKLGVESAIVSPNATPKLHRFLTNWYASTNLADLHSILFEDGRELRLDMFRGDRPSLTKVL